MLLTASLVSPTLSGVWSMGFVGTVKNNTSNFFFYVSLLCFQFENNMYGKNSICGRIPIVTLGINRPKDSGAAQNATEFQH